jgi:hypothetical protein
MKITLSIVIAFILGGILLSSDSLHTAISLVARTQIRATMLDRHLRHT